MAKPLAKLIALITPRRRWTQFSLATMLAVVTVLCVGLSLIVAPAERQRRAVAAIRAAGGLCQYDYEFDADGEGDLWGEPPGPAWLRESLGIDHLANVVGVYFLGASSTPAVKYDLKCLPSLPKLKRLHIDDYPDHPLDEEETEAFSSLTDLHELSLERGTDSLLEAAAGLPNLEVLRIVFVSRDGLRHVGRMSKLLRLSLIAIDDGDAGLAHLARLHRLAELRLVGDEFTDAGLVYLHGLPELRYLHITETNITDAGIAQLQKDLPNCKIDTSWNPDVGW